MILENDDRLKECPFCKNETVLAHVEFPDKTIWYNPQCSVCKAGWNENFETKEEAINEWNKRL